MLRKCVQTNGNTEFFTNVLEPILLSCRLHPSVLIENRDRELNVDRWKDNRPDELFALCEKISIMETSNEGSLITNTSFKQQLRGNVYS
jgi:hypothetical protein